MIDGIEETEVRDTSGIDATWLASFCAGLAVVIALFGRYLIAFLPLMFLAGAACFVVSIWCSGRERKREGKEAAALKAKLAELEERLESAEIVDAFEERLAEKEAALRARRMS